jgi:uncharacterized UBP type Zn finger protein
VQGAVKESLYLTLYSRTGFLGKKQGGDKMNFLKRLLGRQEKNSSAKQMTGDAADYHEGDKVKCGVCGKPLKVKYHDPGKIAIATAAALRGVALRCRSCGFIVCDPCSMPPGGVGMPTCPSCKTLSGPYFFIRK